ncbi:MAG TPA: cytochrome c [Gammaproteobacteria bacterium]|nr:cytochrome c [Gammaproteobacteria bacterium]
MKECKRVGRGRLGGVGILLIAALAAGVSVGYAADPTNGQKIYNQQCASCHGSDGRGAMPGVPNFTLGMALMKSDNSLANTISVGKNVMPGFEGILSEQDIYDVIAYIRTLH